VYNFPQLVTLYYAMLDRFTSSRHTIVLISRKHHALSNVIRLLLNILQEGNYL